MARIRQFCDDRGIALIEDCAHAMFGEADGRPIGSHGHYAIASLTKFLPTADGGCLVYGRTPAKPPALPSRSFADQLRIIANTVEMGAQHHRLPGINRAIIAGFAAANALRGRRRLRRSRMAATLRRATRTTAEFAPDSKLWGGASLWSRWIARSARRGADRGPPAPELSPSGCAARRLAGHARHAAGASRARGALCLSPLGRCAGQDLPARSQRRAFRSSAGTTSGRTSR